VGLMSLPQETHEPIHGAWRRHPCRRHSWGRDIKPTHRTAGGEEEAQARTAWLAAGKRRRRAPHGWRRGRGGRRAPHGWRRKSSETCPGSFAVTLRPEVSATGVAAKPHGWVHESSGRRVTAKDPTPTSAKETRANRNLLCGCSASSQLGRRNKERQCGVPALRALRRGLRQGRAKGCRSLPRASGARRAAPPRWAEAGRGC